MLVRLERQAPARIVHHQIDARLDIGVGIRIVERLDEQMFEIERREPRDVAAGLRPDELQFVAAQLNQLAPRFRADADPVDAARDRKRAVAFDRDGEAAVVQRSEEHTSELQSLMRISYAVFWLKKKKERDKI